MNKIQNKHGPYTMIRPALGKKPKPVFWFFGLFTNKPEQLLWMKAGSLFTFKPIHIFTFSEMTILPFHYTFPQMPMSGSSVNFVTCPGYLIDRSGHMSSIIHSEKPPTFNQSILVFSPQINQKTGSVFLPKAGRSTDTPKS